MATYYVSSEATNGYAVGVDTNNGTDKSTPWLTMDKVSSTLTTGTHAVYLNGAQIVCAAEFIVQAVLTVQGDVDQSEILLRNTTAGAYGTRCGAGKHVTFTNCKLTEGAGGCTSALLYFAPTASLTNHTFTNVDMTMGGVRFGDTAANALANVTITNCTMTHTGTMTDGFAFTNLGATSAVTIDGLVLNISGTCSAGYAAINCEANAAGVAIDCSNVTGTITSALTTANFNYGILISDCDTALIEDCNITINANNGGSNSACLYKITSATITPMVSAVIRNNRGYCNCPAGILICAGEDGTANVAHGIQVYGNTVWGPTNLTTLHGVTVGGNNSCRVYNNSVRYALIGFLAKNCTATVVSGNVAEFILATGEAFRYKGAATTDFIGNLHLISGAWNSKTIYVTNNDGLPNSDGQCCGNAMYAYPGATAQTEIVNMEASQSGVKFRGNNYYPADGLSGSQFNDEATTRTLAAWNAQDHVFNDTSFRFAGRLRSKINHRLLVPVQDAW